MQAIDLLYVAITVAFFLLLDWIVGLIDDRGADARR